MKITPHVLSLPPYISTAWQHITALHVQTEDGVLLLVVDLMNGNRIAIPHLDSAVIEKIFFTHAAYHEDNNEKASSDVVQKNDLTSLLSLHLPDKFLGDGIDKIASVLQHNPEAADSSDLPREILDKVATIAQSLGLEDLSGVPSPVNGCNCLFCQIARTIQAQISLSNDSAQTAIEQEEEVSEEDLRFKNWDILQKDTNLYEVVNPLDTNEHYNVFLGKPIGCTCGRSHCEHIRAVLNS